MSDQKLVRLLVDIKDEQAFLKFKFLMNTPKLCRNMQFAISLGNEKSTKYNNFVQKYKKYHFLPITYRVDEKILNVGRYYFQRFLQKRSLNCFVLLLTRTS